MVALHKLSKNMDENPSVDETIIPSDEPVVEVPVEETGETPEVDSVEPEVVPKAQYDEVHKRATRAEAELKALKPKVVTPKQVSSQPNVEEAVLLANGMSESLLTELKAVASARGIKSLIKAQADPIFVAVKEKFEKDQKQKDASLPVSRGSGSVKAPKTFMTPGLSRDEHRNMVQGK